MKKTYGFNPNRKVFSAMTGIEKPWTKKDVERKKEEFFNRLRLSRNLSLPENK